MVKKVLGIVLLLLVLACVLAACHNKSGGDDSHEHEFTEIDVEEATCTKNGTRELECIYCGEPKSEIIYARGYHEYGDWITTKAATCLTEGTKQRACNDCSSKQTQTIAVDEHRYVDGICMHCDRPQIDITLPDMPTTVNHRLSNNSVHRTFCVISISIKEIEYYYSGDYKVTFTWSGEKTYDINGNYYSAACMFGYKLYDAEGFVVASGTASSVAAKVGDKFRDQEFSLRSSSINPDEIYTLEILDMG